MRRRDFVAGALAAWPLTALAQQQTKPTVIWLDVRPGLEPPEYVEAFRRGLAQIGFSESRDVTVEYLTADGHAERLPALAADVVNRRPAAIYALTAPAALATKQATQTIPIIFTVGADPVELGLVASFSRPGGNITGVAILSIEMAEKRLELLHKAVPAVETVALLAGADQAEVRHMQSAARTLGLRLLVFDAQTDSDLTPVFATLVGHQAGAILVGRSVAVEAKRDQILTLAARFALPTMFVRSGNVRAGGLLSYGAEPLRRSKPHLRIPFCR
jgi:putative tryptophan/tyrosine transport system substrate-binding protein